MPPGTSVTGSALSSTNWGFVLETLAIVSGVGRRFVSGSQRGAPPPTMVGPKSSVSRSGANAVVCHGNRNAR